MEEIEQQASEPSSEGVWGIAAGDVRNPLMTPKRWSVLFSIVAISVASWVVVPMALKAKRQAKAVALIESVGGRARFDWEVDPLEISRLGRASTIVPPKPWLLKTFGPHFLGNVRAIHLPHLGESVNDQLIPVIGELVATELLFLNGNSERVSAISDDGLASLAALKKLRALDIGNSHVKGHGLKHLSGLEKLERLSLVGLPVKDADLAALGTLNKLDTLELTGNELSDEGLKSIARLPNLRRLVIQSKPGICKITEAGLSHLADYTRLIELVIQGSRITSLAPLERMITLETLEITDAPAKDSGIGMLHKLVALRRINLSSTAVTDKVADELVACTRLEEIVLNQTEVTDKCLEKLRPLQACRLIDARGTKTSVLALASYRALVASRQRRLLPVQVDSSGAVAPEFSSVSQSQ